MKITHFLQRRFLTIIICLFGGISIIYLLVFFIHFNGLSTNINDYSIFANYLGGLGSIASVGTLIILLYENNRLQKEKKSEDIKKGLLYLVEHFELNTMEELVFTNPSDIRENIDGTTEYSVEYLSNIESVFNRINYIYESALILKSDAFIDMIKNVILNKLPTNVLNVIKDKYHEEECVTWLRLDNIRWRLNLSMSRRTDF